MNCPVSARDEAAPRYDASLIRALFGYLATAVAISLLAHPLAGSLGVHESGDALCFWGFVLLAPVAALLAARTTRRPTETTIAQDDPGIETLKRLEAEESRYRSLVRNLPVGIFHYDRDLRITEFNDRFAEILHAPGAALQRLDMKTLRDPRVLNALRLTLDGQPGRYEGEYATTLSGRHIRVSLRATPVFAADGTVTGGVGIVEDISAQHEAASMLNESETRYALAMRGTNEGLWDWNPVSHSLFLSSRLLSLLGADGEHLRTTSDEWLKLIHVQDRARFQGALVAHLKGQTPHFECEYRVLDRNGEFRWVLARGLAQRNDRGQAYRMVGSIGDITERKRAEARLQSELTFTRTLIDSLPIALLVVRPDGSISLWNRFFTQTLGYTDEQIADMRTLRLVAPADRAVLEQRMERALRDGEANVRAKLNTRDGRHIPFDFFARSIELEGERRLLCIASDISERLASEAGMRDLNRQLESRVAERTAQLTAALKELEAFSYSVSHDLRAPLRAIDGYSVILATEYDEAFDDEARMLFQRMRAAVQRMGMLIDDLLNLARVSRHNLDRRPVDLSALAAEITQDLARSDAQRKVRFDIEPDLHVTADPNLLRIALENMLGNAWKFTGRCDEAHISVRRAHDENGEACYCIEDNGAGFDMRYADKLFGAFQRLHHERDFQGTGVGLATVARIVQRHGGRIWAHGEPGKGARFCFTLGHHDATAAGPTPASDRPA
jgi:PAS domain S-box-containing protein